MAAYQIAAKITTYVVNPKGQTGVGETKTLLAVGGNGTFRVEQDTNGVPEMRVSDGTSTWKILPKQKLWAKASAAQSLEADDEDVDTPNNNMGQDLFAQTRLSFVKRYTGLERYAGAAQVEGETKLKLNGDKVDCLIVRIPGKQADSRLFLATESGFVVRHIESMHEKDGSQVKVTTDFARIDVEKPPAQLFTFAPLKGGKEVSDVSLPSERNVSLVGQRAADFTLTTLDGTPVHLAELQGKVVLLDFWASWCPPCRHELPTIEALSRRYKDKNVVVLGINDEDQKTARKFLEQHHPDLATLHDEKAKVERMYGCYAIPTVMVINRSGKIVAHFVGERSENELVAALKQAGMQ
jgi:peroxiredoxin